MAYASALGNVDGKAGSDKRQGVCGGGITHSHFPYRMGLYVPAVPVLSSEGHHTFLLADTRRTLLSLVPLPPLPSVIHKQDDNKQLWVVVGSLNTLSPSCVSCPHFPHPVTGLVPTAVSGFLQQRLGALADTDL